MGIRSWIHRRRKAAEARRLVAQAFRCPELLQGTSLKPQHAARWVLVDYELEGESVARIWFGILRHPRPYQFSRQSHKVVEYYFYDVESRCLSVVAGHNVTRGKGRDSDD